jgi:putative colanic acid biosynthesis UDP-glucose lipid carrier transferase
LPRGPTASAGIVGRSSLERHSEIINSSHLKRLLDVLIGSALMIALLPVLLAIALAVAVESPGPVLIGEECCGKGKRVFLRYRLRTTNVASESFAGARLGDERLTRLGALLRHANVDDLIQLVNVLRGDMSLIGPRPQPVAVDNAFAHSLPNYSDRHLVRPGMTGLAQVAVFGRPTEAPGAIAERLRHDRLYIQTWSIWLDLKILTRTPLALIRSNAL